MGCVQDAWNSLNHFKIWPVTIMALPARGTGAMLTKSIFISSAASLVFMVSPLQSAQAIENQANSVAADRADIHQRAIALSREASRSFGAGDRARALALFAEALRLSREALGEQHPDTITSINNYAFALRSVGRAAEAEPLFAEALSKSREVLGDRHPDTLTSLNNYAAILETLGRAAEAEPLHAEALLLRREVLGERNADTLQSMNNYAVVLVALGRASEAEPIYRETLRLRSETLGDRHPDTLQSMNNYASVLQSLGRATQAERFYADVLRLRRNLLGEQHPDTLSSLNSYALILRALGRDDEAKPLLEETLRIRRQVLSSEHPDTIISLGNYASVLKALGRLAEAEPLSAEALHLGRQVMGAQHPDTIKSLNNYAGLLWALGRLAEAEPLLAQALLLNRQVMGTQHPNTIISLNNLATVRRDLGRATEAELLYAEALRLGREVLGPGHPETLVSLKNYALLLLEAGSTEQALQLYRELALAIRSRAVDLTGDGFRGSAQSDRELGNRQRVEKFFADALWANVGGGAADRKDLLGEAFTSLQLASAASTSRAVAEASASRFASARGMQGLVRERQSLSRAWMNIEVALIESQIGGEEASVRRQLLQRDLERFENRIGEIDRQLAREAPQYFAILNQQAVTLEQIRAVLDEGEAVLLLVPTAFGTHSFAITHDDVRWARSDLNDAAIEAEVGDFREGLEIQAGDPNLPLFDLEQAHSLYSQLIEPVESIFRGASRLYIVADGDLSRLPLGTLVASKPAAGADADDPDVLRQANWLADRYAIVQLPSLQSLYYIRTLSAGAGQLDGIGFTGFGAPVLAGEANLRGARSATLAPVEAASLLISTPETEVKPLMEPEALRQLSSLPGTQLELERVRDALGAIGDNLYLGERMTETAIRSASLSSTRILHLATHGFTSEESGSLAEPGLVFTPPATARPEDDGYLAASEIVGLDLSSAEWVILSACNTASPSGRRGETGLSGLAQAFLYAGAESLLVSHWPVFDDIAPILTLEALRRSQAGEPRAEALQAAMRTIRNAPELDAAHPAVWAPFALVGEGR